MQRGGYREGAGRKPKADEEKLLQRLSPLEDLAFEKLKEGIGKGDVQCLKLFFEYMYGKPKQSIDANVSGGLQLVWHEERTYETK